MTWGWKSKFCQTCQRCAPTPNNILLGPLEHFHSEIWGLKTNLEKKVFWPTPHLKFWQILGDLGWKSKFCKTCQRCAPTPNNILLRPLEHFHSEIWGLKRTLEKKFSDLLPTSKLEFWADFRWLEVERKILQNSLNTSRLYYTRSCWDERVASLIHHPNSSMPSTIFP